MRRRRLPGGVVRASLLGLGAVLALGLSDAVDAVPQQPQSRAEALRAQRQARAAQIAPPERSGVEGGLFKVEANYLMERLQAGWHDIHPVFGGLPTGSGLGLGFRYINEGLPVTAPGRAAAGVGVDLRAPNRTSAELGAVASFKGYLTADGEFAWHRIAGSPLNTEFRAGYRRYTQEDFFGIGRDSLEANRTSYLYEDAALTVGLWWEEPYWLRIGADVSQINANTGPGSDRRFPSIEELFTPDDVPALDRQPDYLRTGAYVEIDWRDEEFNPRSGGYYAFRADNYDEDDFGAFDFRRYVIDLHQYFPFLNKHRVFAFRAHLAFSDTDAGQSVPFYLQPDLGGSRSLRGFRERRFRDNNAALFTVEYRWEAWIGLDMALFMDAGNVFDARSDWTDFDNYRTSYGLGFRFNTYKGVFLRVDLANSPEGFKSYVTFDHVF